MNSFPSFFRSTQANKGYWAAGNFFGGKKRSARTIPESADENFMLTWQKLRPVLNNGDEINIWQFLVVTSIMINETGGTFVPVSENGDLQYMFGTNNGKKKSYNTYKANRTVFDLLNDELFTDTHKHSPFDDYVISSGKSNTEWKGEIYPDNISAKPAEAGIVSEADFYKFRGRGLIQTTFRDNYIPLIEQVLSYKGINTAILQYKNYWMDHHMGDVQKIASASKNEDWDELFMHTDLEFAALGVKTFFDKRPGSLNFKTDNDYHINGTNTGSLYHIGHIVGGTDNYGKVLRARVLQIYEGLKKGGLLDTTLP